MKNILLAVSALFFLTACDPFEGVLSVKDTFIVKSTDKNSGKVELVTIPAGELSAKFEFPSKNEITIKTKINNKKKTIKIVLPQKLSIPDNGAFYLPPTALDQSFAAQGKTLTNVTEGPLRSGYQGCTYQRRETYCFTDPKGNVVCQDRWVTAHGQQYVEYHERQTHQELNLEFIDASSTRLFASFQGERNSTQQITHYQGQCY